jgi:hypothetical protein
MLDIGDTVTVSEFAFTNPSGGTGLSDWEYNERFSGVAKAVIVEAWDDYEAGRRMIGRALSPDLCAYLERNAASDDQRVFLSEFDVLTWEKG